MVDFSKYQKKEISEPQIPIEADIPEKPFSEPKTTFTIKSTKEKIGGDANTLKSKKIIASHITDTLIGVTLNKSARLNLIKFLYPLLTGKTTTNKLKKVMKKAVVDKLSNF